MKKVNVLLILMVILLGALSLYKLSNKYDLNILKSNIDCTIVVKGCEKARALSADDDKNIYIVATLEPVHGYGITLKIPYEWKIKS